MSSIWEIAWGACKCIAQKVSRFSDSVSETSNYRPGGLMRGRHQRTLASGPGSGWTPEHLSYPFLSPNTAPAPRNPSWRLCKNHLGKPLHHPGPPFLACKTRESSRRWPPGVLFVLCVLVLIKTRHFVNLTPGGTRDAFLTPGLQRKRPGPARGKLNAGCCDGARSFHTHPAHPGKSLDPKKKRSISSASSQLSTLSLC